MVKIEFIHGEYLVKPDGDIMAVTYKSEDTDPAEVKRYAVLFAAAPDLLEALKEMTELAEGPTGGVTVAMKRAILAKARAAMSKAVSKS